MSSSAFGLLLLRLVVGLVMMGHGAQKVFGWFGGPGWASSAEALRSQGLKPGWLWALLAGVGEGFGKRRLNGRKIRHKESGESMFVS